jgi:hypothetical protein
VQLFLFKGTKEKMGGEHKKKVIRFVIEGTCVKFVDADPGIKGWWKRKGRLTPHIKGVRRAKGYEREMATGRWSMITIFYSSQQM